jgi:Ca-activated chloride channel family protein
MSRRSIIILLSVLLAVTVGPAAYAQCVRERPEVASGPPSVLIVMDASKSMAKPAGGGQTRLEAAKEALRTLVRELPEDARVGLRLYGHRFSETTEERGCTDTELVSPVGPLDRGALRKQIESYDAVGFTPIGRALREGAGDLPREGPTSIVLVSDGGDNCAPPDPCDTAEEISQDGTSVSIQSIGFQVTERAREQLQCIAEAGDGMYRDARDAGELALALRALAARGLRTPTPQGRPITGGPGPEQAVAIGAGAFVDDLAMNEQRWYSVELAAGQRLAASASLLAPCAPEASDIGSVFRIEFLGADGSQLSPGVDYAQPNLFFGGQFNTVSVGVLGQVGRSLEGPGTYLVKVELQGNAEAERLFPVQFGRERLPMELLVDLGAQPGQAKRPPPDAGEALPADDDGSVGIGVVVLVGVLAFAIAAGATVMLARRGGRPA